MWSHFRDLFWALFLTETYLNCRPSMRTFSFPGGKTPRIGTETEKYLLVSLLFSQVFPPKTRVVIAEASANSLYDVMKCPHNWFRPSLRCFANLGGISVKREGLHKKNLPSSVCVRLKKPCGPLRKPIYTFITSHCVKSPSQFEPEASNPIKSM